MQDSIIKVVATAALHNTMHEETPQAGILYYNGLVIVGKVVYVIYEEDRLK